MSGSPLPIFSRQSSERPIGQEQIIIAHAEGHNERRFLELVDDLLNVALVGLHVLEFSRGSSSQGTMSPSRFSTR